jgi:TonB family protein
MAIQTLLISAALAAEPSPILYSRTVQGWNVFGGRGVCIMEAGFDGGTKLSATVRADRQGVYFHLENPAWKSIRPGQELKLDVEMDARGEWSVDARGAAAGSGFLFERSEATNEDGDNFIAEFALARTIRIRREGLGVQALSLKGSRAAILALFECRARLRSAPGFDPFADAVPGGAKAEAGPVGGTARAKANIPSLFSDEDYPASALRAGEQGTVRYRLEIGANGRVTGSAVTVSSGSAALDSTTCRLLRSRARFTPARDGNGNPVPDTAEGAVVWRLPADPEPAPPAPVPDSAASG